MEFRPLAHPTTATIIAAQKVTFQSHSDALSNFHDCRLLQHGFNHFFVIQLFCDFDPCSSFLVQPKLHCIFSNNLQNSCSLSKWLGFKGKYSGGIRINKIFSVWHLGKNEILGRGRNKLPAPAKAGLNFPLAGWAGFFKPRKRRLEINYKWEM